MDRKKIGERFRQFRKGKNLTQQELAARLNTSPGFISEIEIGKKSPGSETLYSLQHEFELNINWLLSGEGAMYTAARTPEVGSNLLVADNIKDAIQKWIDDFWSGATENQKAWFTIEMERSFPEVAESLRNIKTRQQEE